MARADERREYTNVLTAVIGVLFVLVSWFLSDKASQIKEDISTIRQDFRTAHAELRALSERLSRLEYSKR